MLYCVTCIDEKTKVFTATSVLGVIVDFA